jgi:hypothetical protein
VEPEFDEFVVTYRYLREKCHIHFYFLNGSLTLGMCSEWKGNIRISNSICDCMLGLYRIEIWI